MSGPYRVVQQIGDATFVVRDNITSQPAAILLAADMTANSDEEIELFVDGPDGVVEIGQPRRFNGEWD